MIAEGIVQEIEPATPSRNPGRKTHPIDIVPDAKLFAGIEMRGSRRTACVTNYRGTLLCSAEDDTYCREYEPSLRLSCELFQRMLEEHQLSLDRLSGIAFCVPGLVDRTNGILKIHPGYNWVKKNVCADAAALIGYTGPISLENNACARSTSAQMFHRDMLNHVGTFAYLFIASGIACPFILNESTAFGSVVGTGEVGHMVMDFNGPLCVCGNHGCLETFSSDHAIVSACADAMRQGRAACLHDLSVNAPALTMEAILEAQSCDDADVQAIIEKALFVLGIAIANITNFSSPELMLIEGKLFSNPRNQKFLVNTVKQNLYSSINSNTEFAFMNADNLSGAKGAAAVAISRDLESYCDKR